MTPPQVDRRAPRRRPCERRHGDRPRADDDRAAAPARRGGQVHRVLRPRPRRAHRRRPGDHLQHVARVRGDGVDVPGRRRDPALPARHRPRGRARRRWSSATRRSRGSSATGSTSPSRPTPRRSTSTSPPSSRAWPGPRRPQDRVSLPQVGDSFADAFGAGRNGGGLGDGSVVISAITSCTNTSNPALMVAAGLVARKAVERGLTTKPWVKTSLAPGSRVVVGYLAPGGPHGAARAARLQPRRLRLHHVHRELRARCPTTWPAPSSATT